MILDTATIAMPVGDEPCERPAYDPEYQRRLERLSPETIETAAALTGPDAITPALASERFDVSIWTIYKRRRRAEMMLGEELPRPNRRGRPRKPLRKK
jgi:hypothetical protein